ncbi:MAG: hypothetical protein A4E49_02028 [Methanosaeta sp. PtaU1.Bin112]|nr:MAG: hypothetical protein A4E49_02028 [Methanosaeta sp. PtaU1.Bin112]
MRSFIYLLAAVLMIECICALPLDQTKIEPIYLGKIYHIEPIMISGAGTGISSNALNQSLWKSDTGFNFAPRPNYALFMDSLDIRAYHTPTIVNFLSDDFIPPGMNYSYYIPALGNFASPNWMPSRDIHLYHIPAITDFLIY